MLPSHTVEYPALCFLAFLCPENVLALQASVTSLAWDKHILSLTSELSFSSYCFRAKIHPPLLPCFFFCLLEKEGWAEPRPCNLRPDFHWKQMLSIRCKDRLMFSKAYNNKPRGLSHASWENRSKRLEHQLGVSEYASWGKRWDIMRSTERKGVKGAFTKGDRESRK